MDHCVGADMNDISEPLRRCGPLYAVVGDSCTAQNRHYYCTTVMCVVPCVPLCPPGSPHVPLHVPVSKPPVFLLCSSIYILLSLIFHRVLLLSIIHFLFGYVQGSE